jgi:hypothetical protein
MFIRKSHLSLVLAATTGLMIAACSSDHNPISQDVGSAPMDQGNVTSNAKPAAIGGTVSVTIPAYGYIGRNAQSGAQTFVDPTPLGAEIISIDGAVTTKGWWSNSAIAQQDYILNGDAIGHTVTSAPPVWTPHSFSYTGHPANYVKDGVNSLSVVNHWNGIDMGAVTLVITYGFPIVEVNVDIKPDGEPNSINLKSKGVTPVAILGSADYDVADIDVSSIAFGPSGAAPVKAGSYEDVDGDGLTDLVLHFKTQEIGLNDASTEAALTGTLNDGTDIQGADSVRIVPGSSRGGRR